MSKIQVAAVMCDDEYGCDSLDVTYFEHSGHDVSWGITTRDNVTEHLCWDCVYRANEWDDHYLRTEARP